MPRSTSNLDNRCFNENMVTANTSTNLGSALENSAGIVLASPDVTIANNLFVANRVRADSNLRTCATAILADEPVDIINNTFFGNEVETGGSIPLPPLAPFDPRYPAQAAISLGSSGSRVINNIFERNTSSIRPGDLQAHSISNNCFHGQRAPNENLELPKPPPESNGNIYSDPKLVGPYSVLHLAPDSPCRDGGHDDAVGVAWKDYDGDQRIIGAAVDIGADEFNGSTPIPQRRRVYVSEGGDDQADGLSWDTAKATIQRGIDTASLMAGAEVWVASGIYRERVIVGPFTYLHGGFAGSESPTDGRDLLNNPCLLDAEHLGTAVTMNAPGPFFGRNRSHHH